MMHERVFTQSLPDCRDAAVVGGKAANLGRSMRAGLPVPGGFVITTRAYQAARERSADGSIPADVVEEIRSSYIAMGAGRVAVRSSATAEDMAEASMAGQYETFLDLEGEAALLDAVRKCWASLDAPRVRAYLEEHGTDPAGVALAVVVQRLVPADVAGVLFTAAPNCGQNGEMLIEASWGLGESIVSGRVQPDMLRLDRETGRVLDATIADKHVCLAAGAGEERPVGESRRRQPCLKGRDVYRLWQLGRRVAEHFGSPQDIEWAIYAGDVYVLQSRPITTLQGGEGGAEVLCAARRQLREALRVGRGPWVLHNLAETCPHPTPLTWSVLKRFMSGSGGLGAMYRQAGFEPSALADRDGFLDLIAGRIYMDASRAPEMFFEDFPFAYDSEDLKRGPDASQTPPTLPRGSFRRRVQARRQLVGVRARLQALCLDLDRRLREDLFPSMVGYVAAAGQTELSALSGEGLVELWQEHEKYVLDRFASQALLPSLVCMMAMGELRAFLAEHFWDDEPDELARFISSGGPPDRTVVADAELYDVATGNHSVDAWLADYGHRAVGGFELAAPRWREQPLVLSEMAARLANGKHPSERHRRNREEVARRIEDLRARLSGRDRRELDRRIDLLQRYVGFREDSKDFLMLGMELLRKLALEAGRRLDVGEDIFHLTREDLFDALRVGFAPFHVIAQRKAAHRAEARLELPQVIDAAAVEGLGKPIEVKPVTGGYRAFAVSSGEKAEATGPARILRSPTEGGELGRGYILVCPSTDPSWTPLFVNAAGLVLERAGTLSHGAVVARELGLPAVVLAGATRLFHEGDEIRVDGRRGWVGPAARELDRSPPDAVADLRHGETLHEEWHGEAQCDGWHGQAQPYSAELARGGRSHLLPPHGQASARSTGPALAHATPGHVSTSARVSDRPCTLADPEDTRVPQDLVPPPPGRKERRAGRLRNTLGVFWTAYLLAFFLLPRRWVHDPSMWTLDLFLWPIVRALGKPAAVALIAGGMAVMVLVVQRLVTDNRRLREAKRRVAALKRQAEPLPGGSPRRVALMRLTRGVAYRTFAAAMVPVGLLLGPLVMPFAWLKDRVDPAVWNAPAGSAVQVVAMVDGEFAEPVRLEVPPGVTVDDATPASRTLPPIRRTLERLLAFYRRAHVDASESWELRVASDVVRRQAADDLQAYLEAGIPPQGLMWLIRPPAGMSGRFPVSVTAAGYPPVAANVVLGDDHPPVAPYTVVIPGSPARELRVVYPKPREKPTFWRPLAGLEGYKRIPGAARLAAIDVGWLWLYVIVYVAVLIPLRRLLRLA